MVNVYKNIIASKLYNITLGVSLCISIVILPICTLPNFPDLLYRVPLTLCLTMCLFKIIYPFISIDN